MINEKNIYDLSPQEFEKLVADLLSATGYSDLQLVGYGSLGADIRGKLHDKPVAIRVTHKLQLKAGDIAKIVHEYFSNVSTPRSLIFVTSADIVSADFIIRPQLLPDQEFRLLGRKDILQLITDHPDIAGHFFKVAQKRSSGLKMQLIASIAAAVISLISLGYSSYMRFVAPQVTLDNRIKNVENALTSIRDLETYLNKIKQDMVATETATQQLNEKYAKAKELGKLTQAQVDALKATLQAESWHRTLFTSAMGFILGIASSFVASVLYTKWRQREALK
jgi:hypothetical protein